MGRGRPNNSQKRREFGVFKTRRSYHTSAPALPRPRSFDPEASTPKLRPRSFDPEALTRKLRPRSLDPEASTPKLPPGSFHPEASTPMLRPGSFHPEASTPKLRPRSFDQCPDSQWPKCHTSLCPQGLRPTPRARVSAADAVGTGVCG